jgi:hypothetical protein
VLNETYKRLPIGKILSDALIIQNGLKQGGTLSPLPSNLALECGIRNIEDDEF